MSTIRAPALPFLRSAIAALLAIASPVAATAQSIEEFYRGKTLRIIVPSTPGGDRALYVLAFVPFFGKHIPGNPTVTPVFMPGAGGSNGVNYTYSVAAADGLSIVTPLTGVVMAQAMGEDSVRYDVSKFQLDRAHLELNAHLLRVDQGQGAHACRLQDARGRCRRVGRASETYLNPAFMNNVFGTKFKIVLGYQGRRQDEPRG